MEAPIWLLEDVFFTPFFDHFVSMKVAKIGAISFKH